MEQKVKIKEVVSITHDVKQFKTEKPAGYNYTPGHATEVSINKEGWQDKKRPFTFTSLHDADHLEFVIKIYPDHDGVTEQMDALEPGDELILRDTWGAIEYNGPGYIIAGGAGITPYIAMLRDLKRKDKLEGMKLLFSNKTEKDIILKAELDALLGEHATYVITDQKDTSHKKGHIDQEFLKKEINDFDQKFYVCGPPKMTKEIAAILENLGADPNQVTLDDQ
ncbi:FAD-binding oxidoreductase [Nonlabens antarcticus]|uniref:FAD-binding oxidoreductase n=1 Tax=Nonlabens antarcticus TaxID=392714 RepID=UPI001891C83D|nr:FAD-binding oxidoreductase [Nonlabens antarcticus]